MSEPQGLKARQAAQDILSEVLRKRRPLDVALERIVDLDPRDAGFARAIASETLRRFGQLDALIRTFMHKPAVAAPRRPDAAKSCSRVRASFCFSTWRRMPRSMAPTASRRPMTRRCISSR